MGSTAEEIEAAAVRARAEADALAIRGRAEVDARALRTAAQADADAIRARAELDVAMTSRQADADRQEAHDLLEGARHQAVERAADATDVRRHPERERLVRLRATRADLRDAIERLGTLNEPVIDLTDGAGLESADGPAGPAAGLDRDSPTSDRFVSQLDPVAQLVRSAIGRAVESATASSREGGEPDVQPARRREELRDGRRVL